VLVEGAGGGDILSESAAGVVDAAAPGVEEGVPVEIDADAAPIDPSALEPEPPTSAAPAVAAESAAPEIDLDACLAGSAPTEVEALDPSPASPPSPEEEGVEIDLEASDMALPSIEYAAESGSVEQEEETALDPTTVAAEPELDAPKEGVPEYEIPETSFDDVAKLIGEESLAPPVEPTPPQPADVVSELLPPPPVAATPPEAPVPVEPAPPAAQPASVAPAAASPTPAPPTAEPPAAPAPATPAPLPSTAEHAATAEPPAAVAARAPAPPPASTPPDPDWGTEFRHPVWIPDSDTDDPELKRAEGGRVHELEDVIGTFREQMAQALGDDASARYDLGVAYYEVGLYNEALAGFEVAVRKPSMREQCLEMMAACLTMQGRHAEIVALLTPLMSSAESAGVGLGLRYTMGVAYEALGRREEARQHFEAVALVDSGYRDVQARLQRF
jgi:hypothetical protein